MGCDIHLVLERKVDDHWVAVDTFKGHESAMAKGYTWPAATSRNYQRFAALASVRGEGPSPRGIPADPSDTTSFLVEKWGEDGHSHSWLPLVEAAAIYLATDQCGQPSKYRDEYPCSHFFGVDENEAGDHRLVFWFDN
jgi:hypothetical protein